MASGGSGSPSAAEVRALRPPKPTHDPWRPQGVTVEAERGPGGESVPSATVFLTGAECPFTCVFCDLWRHTIDGPTPAGALPAQLRAALDRLPGLLRDAGLDRCDQLKLYNASNFFDPRAVPEADLEPIARLAAPFRRVTVECHPRLVDDRVRRFAELLPGRLEVAMGLETAHPEALARLGKQLTLEQFDRAAQRLRADGVDLRVFVLVGVPFVPAEEQAEWAVASVRHAARAGARTVALIPVRGGNGELERLRRLGQFEPPDLALLEECLAGAAEVAAARSPEHGPDDARDGARPSPAVPVFPEDRRRVPRPSLAVQVDPWDLDRVASACEACRDERVAAIREMNRTGAPRRTVCDDCGDRAVRKVALHAGCRPDGRRAERRGDPMTVAPERREIVVAGGGFAGSILARALHAEGRDVLLLERGRHPRFALGESSTPLANLALERLAVRYGFEDLWDLAAHGRWRRRLPQVGRGLKRGFCFYSHEPGEVFSPGPSSGRRLVVAASPDDDAADNQWLRADVDRFLFERARAEGVDCREGTAVEIVADGGDARDGALRIRAGGRIVEAGLLVDATGGSPLAAGLGARPAVPRLQTSLVYSHFVGVAPFDGAAGWPASPFPERWSASHHLLEEGWMYQLRFDDGTVSAGFLLKDEPPGAPESVFAALLDRYPSLALQFADSAPLRPVASRSNVASRRDRAAGRGWLLLPHSYAFADPMFSTGIAWSLLAVERVADLCRNGLPAADDLERYARLVAAEADHVDRLLAAAYRLMPAMDRFTAAAMVYFAAASFDELRQRLLDFPREGWCWQGFLGADDGRRRLFEELDERSAVGGENGLPNERSAAGGGDGPVEEWVGPAIERWNLIGLLDPRRRNAYPVDLEDMERRTVQVATGLGLAAAELHRRWPRLRSPDRMP